MTPNDLMLFLAVMSFVLMLTMAGMLLWLVHETGKSRAAMSGYVAAIAHSSRVADYTLSAYDTPNAFQAAVRDFSRIMCRADRVREVSFDDFWRVAA